MTPSELRGYLDRLVENRLYLSTMIWGPPGVGKSSIVAQIATSRRMGFIDVRLGQFAPTDLRGLPVAEAGLSRWYPPEFLPTSGQGILFLDELNMAPPTMQGIAQQLILDRRVGSYVVPDGWFIWAAGNRKEDKASVFDMPAPLANRFVHLTTLPDFDSWKAYALNHTVHEQIIAFLSFRTTLLHKQEAGQAAWPSPRSWEMASRLHGAGLDIAPVVGEGAASEFEAYRALYANLPDLAAILDGKGKNIAFPKEPSVRYASTVGLTVRADTADKAFAASIWLVEKAGAEWVNLYISDTFATLRNRSGGQFAQLLGLMNADSRLSKATNDFVSTMAQ